MRETLPRTVIVRNPATGEEISRHVEMDADALRTVIRQARDAQARWYATPLKTRIACVRRMREWLVAHADETAQAISHCTGKLPMEALAFDVLPSVFGSAWYCRHARRCLADETLPGGNVFLLNKRSRLHREPRGVIGVISPWNYPLGIPMHEIVPALLAGNAIVFKTAPETLPVGECIEAMCRDAGIPAGIFNHVIVDGPLCGDVMLEAGGVDKLFFTGSVRVGRILAEKAARNFIDISLELGGKDAMIVLDDADIDRAARGATWAGMQNAGQSCAGVERVYVQRGVYDAFLDAVKREVEQLRVQGPPHAGRDMGVMTTHRQAATVSAQIEEALRDGATVHAGSVRSDTHTVSPAVLVNVHHGMRIMQEETFGPVFGVMPFWTDEEAAQLANDSRYGLTASIWSGNAVRARRLARHLDAGAITINDHLMSHGMTETPWGGVKESGSGRGHGRIAFEAVTKLKVVIDDRLGFLPRNPWWYPYSARAYNALKDTMLARHGNGARLRLRALRRLLMALPSMFRS